MGWPLVLCCFQVPPMRSAAAAALRPPQGLFAFPLAAFTPVHALGLPVPAAICWYRQHRCFASEATPQAPPRVLHSAASNNADSEVPSAGYAGGSSEDTGSYSKRPPPSRRVALLAEEIVSLTQQEADAFSAEISAHLTPVAAGAVCRPSRPAASRRGPPTPVCPFPHPLALFLGSSPVGVFGVREHTSLPLWCALILSGRTLASETEPKAAADPKPAASGEALREAS
ncbi:hypothetical protein cyc_03217 [Cyclospora cayetanensis]|uniref:Uncharacterized protein n=1 Tax=Cyclospora cayetanensis TaxID=88456 RepID=A0A1D3D7D4_9EIME|nr:hypothetical protein cyc_03217 [Cyclospora cayetanensis]